MKPLESMNSIAALYDVHGNLPALEAVLRRVSELQISHVVFGGDVVLGPMPRETLAMARSLSQSVSFVRGNCDRLVVAAADGALPSNIPQPTADALAWCATQLSTEDIEFLRGFADAVTLDVDGLGPVRFVHATPRSDEEIFTTRTSDERVAEMFAAVSEPSVVCGHTHMQFERKVGDLTILNAGSVGMPYGDPGAYWCHIAATPVMRTVSYDLRAAAERVRRTAYPSAEEFASREILAPLGREFILDALSRRAN
jgi:predicted phosphodiesterase